MAVLLTDEEFEAQIDAIDAEVDAVKKNLFDRLTDLAGYAAFTVFILFCLASWVTPGDDLQSLLAFWIGGK